MEDGRQGTSARKIWWVKGNGKQADEKQPNEEISGTSADATKCLVCLDTIQSLKMKALPCAHVFHEICIDKWLVNSQVCPICRCPAVDTSNSVSMHANGLRESREIFEYDEHHADSSDESHEDSLNRSDEEETLSTIGEETLSESGEETLGTSEEESLGTSEEESLNSSEEESLGTSEEESLNSNDEESLSTSEEESLIITMPSLSIEESLITSDEESFGSDEECLRSNDEELLGLSDEGSNGLSVEESIKWNDDCNDAGEFDTDDYFAVYESEESGDEN